MAFANLIAFHFLNVFKLLRRGKQSKSMSMTLYCSVSIIYFTICFANSANIEPQAAQLSQFLKNNVVQWGGTYIKEFTRESRRAAVVAQW